MFYYGNYTSKIWWLIAFEPLDINQSYVPHLKALVSGINASRSQWCGFIFILCYIYLKLTILLYKQGFVDSQIVTAVAENSFFPFLLFKNTKYANALQWDPAFFCKLYYWFFFQRPPRAQSVCSMSKSCENITFSDLQLPLGYFSNNRGFLSFLQIVS